MTPVAAVLGLAAALATAAPPPAANCWTPDTIGAARIREMEIMLRGVSLRCRHVGRHMDSDFERFRIAQQGVLQVTDGKLKARFGADQSRAGQLSYDRYMIRLFNSYGQGTTTPQTCAMFHAVIGELARPATTADRVAALAFDLVRDPLLDSPRCPPVTARAR